jgi:hypothetical protein
MSAHTFDNFPFTQVTAQQAQEKDSWSTRQTNMIENENPFGDSRRASPEPSLSENQLWRSQSAGGGRGKHRFVSYRLKGKYEQPWADDPRMKRTRYNNWIIWSFMFVGLILSAFICFTGYRKVAKNEVRQHEC